jgi:hypothetical protein
MPAVSSKDERLEEGFAAGQVCLHVREGGGGVLALELVSQECGASSGPHLLDQRRQPRPLEPTQQRLGESVGLVEPGRDVDGICEGNQLVDESGV